MRRRKIGRPTPEKLEFARKMRENPTKAEAALWEHLKDKQLGANFKRQAVIRGWIADFWCSKHGLVVEVDGGYHKRRKRYDSFRDAIISGLGVTILRFTNEEIFDEIGCVLKHIKAHMK